MKLATATFLLNSADVAAEVVEGEAVIINVVTGTYYSTEGVGGWIWERAAKGDTFRQIVGDAAQLYAVGEDQAGVDTAAFLDEAIGEGLLIESAADGAAERHAGSLQTPRERLEYRAPRLIIYRDMKDLLALDPPMPNIDTVPEPRRRERQT